MAIKSTSIDVRTRSSVKIMIILGLCCFFYILGAWQKTRFGKGDSITLEVTKKVKECDILHHGGVTGDVAGDDRKGRIFKQCLAHFTDYTPCQDPKRAMKFPRDSMIHRERHCPAEEEKLDCLIPAPIGYATPFSWPDGRDYVPYANAPYKSLTVKRATRNWIQHIGNVFRFQADGADQYINRLATVIPIQNGTVRTALDTGCGVASLGAYLLGRNVIAMSFAPRDSHSSKIQFALERGVPAVIGVLGTIKLPYPARAFDMAHCSRCLIPWAKNDGMYLKEIDRVLRPGGYWILSGPPVNWKNHYTSWSRPKEVLEEEQRKIEEIAKLLCWEKKYESSETAIWQKRIDNDSCTTRNTESIASNCSSTDADDVWYKKMEGCITPYPREGSTRELKAFSERLYDGPPRISSGSITGILVEAYHEDSILWTKRVKAYRKINKLISTGRYRNFMDMNAGVGGFAAALHSSKLWVMNVVPTIADIHKLGVIYERGLIGIYHDWCEAFSTYPRTYDLIHANGVFSLYKNKCKFEQILLEMDRILRPEGAVIFRDEVDVLIRVRKIVGGMRWDTKMVDHEDGPLVPQKILVAVKQYWVVSDDLGVGWA